MELDALLIAKKLAQLARQRQIIQSSAIDGAVKSRLLAQIAAQEAALGTDHHLS